jgi:hypothetical protein
MSMLCTLMQRTRKERIQDSGCRDGEALKEESKEQGGFHHVDEKEHLFWLPRERLIDFNIDLDLWAVRRGRAIF